ncbi:MAG: selenocysteine-specific translation elongation factor [Planctomycetota bacterium]|nr:selenocysteine-specific translation elongation factor [Planctomycetota bacterium]
MSKPKDQGQEAEGHIFNCVLGTAGHIDHGKSSIVQRLTGIDPDRLPEEKQRKLTIDLGFAPWHLDDGRTVGIIDVPGHERFIKNMVAGATGIDVVLLVVAADDGIMPQTREHLEILSLLGIEKGIIAVTKIDLVDSDFVEIVSLELEEFLAGTFLEDAPVVPVSSITGEGFDKLYEAILKAFSEIRRRDEDGAFRMPVQRVFSAKGFGTILTGVPISGQVKVGDVLEILPHGTTGKVRGIQAYKKKVDEARAGHSTALNIPDIDWRKVERGAVLATPKIYSASKLLEVRLQYSDRLTKPLKSRSRIRFHAGTNEILGEIIVLDQSNLEPGGTALCQIRLDEPIVVIPGDPFVLRLHSPLQLLGGGQILGVSEYRLKAGKDFVIERLRKKEEAVGSLEEQIVLALQENRFQSRNLKEIATKVNRRADEIKEIVGKLVESEALVEIKGKSSGRYLDKRSFLELRKKILEVLTQFHKNSHLRVALLKNKLAQQLKIDVAVLNLASSQEDEIEAYNDNSLKLKSHSVVLDQKEEKLSQSIVSVFESKPFETPRRHELIAEVLKLVGSASQQKLEDIFDWLTESNQIIELSDKILLLKKHHEAAQKIAVEMIKEAGQLSTADFRGRLETSRKYAIPILESFDKLGLTKRVGDKRVLC